MGSPVSVVVAEIVIQHVEELALATCRQTIPLWLRYVDDTFTAVHKDEIDDFHDHLNEQNADIQFTKEIEENGKLPYVLIHYVQTNVNYLPLKYPQNQVQQSMGGSHADPNTFITPF